MLIGGQSLDPEPPRRHVAQKRPGRRRGSATPDQTVHFGRYRCGDNQVTAFGAQHVADRGMQRVSRIPQSDQRCRVND